MRPILRRAALALTMALALPVIPAMAADKLTVLLDWFVNPDHAPLVIAKEGGFFARHDLDVDLIAPADASAPPRLVAAGQADIAVSYQPDLMLQVKEGLPLVRIGTLVETPLNCLIVLKDGPIKTLADLKGKKVGYSVASLQDAYIGAILGSAGLTAKDVEMVNVNFNLTTALMSGQVDAVIDGYRNFELTQLAIEGKPGIAFFPEEHGVPPYDELVYVTRKDLATDPRMARFIAAVEEATIFLTNHPDEGLALFLKAHPDLDDKLNRTAYADTLPRFAKRPAALDPGRYDRFAAFLKDKGLLDTIPPVESYAIAPR
ncbi:putative hydroxymethylpyrimidine transport system substrate-binding protein [Kaistia soli DSM 19436]|uniref:Putative hydroxymethylpyrimidine transport system substrate-binding protein n=1 Tax=Kaistia soli DSM 19436 TaxID=1122133 RepID=A0A1M5MEG4_9HYPH|nr:ABC transporter substrate-binding protein [Kaistia soli]SHG75552.1 putative hydroxymethylpyrimidine transport system substrate-binding protein [Kaistia soli DSM 19436]